MNKGSISIIVFMGFVVLGLILLIIKTYQLHQEERFGRLENKVLKIISEGNQTTDEIQKILYKNRKYKKLPILINRFLTISAMIDDEQLTEFLISQNADVNFIYDPFYGEFVTPLMIASDLGHIKSLKVLLKHKADVTLLNHKGQTALMHSCIKDHVHYSYYNILNSKINDLELNIKRIDLTEPEDFNVQLEIIRLLIEGHPDILQIKDSSNKTAYDYAIESGEKKIINYLGGFK
ncbi:MAG: ankyrin repeat domain-containing protein [Spirochaetes bacterium]|nr:ankyrin repeat domain-containing protein [Spirochaetota bacterium]